MDLPNQILLTVAVPTYNRLSDLKVCLKSIESSCALVNEVVEICVSDNCSTDGTSEFLSQYKCPLPNVVLKWKRNSENIGGTPNIKSMFEFCSGRYVYWVTDDDLMLPEAIGAVIQEIRKSEPSYIRTAMIVNLVVSKRSRFYGPRRDGAIEVGSSDFWKILGYSHTLTGTVHVNDPVILSKIVSNKNVYVCTDMLLFNTRKMVSISKVCNIHVWENEVYWDDEINYVNATGKEKKVRQRMLDDDFQKCVYYSPIYKELEKSSLVKFLTGELGFLCDEILKDIQSKPGLQMERFKGILRFRAVSLARHIYSLLRNLRYVNGR